MDQLPGLFAFDIDTVVKVVLPLVVGLIWLALQLVGAAGTKKIRPRPNLPPVEPVNLEDHDMDPEIGDLLRRVAGRRQGNQPAEIEIVVPRPRPAVEEPVEVEIVADSTLGGRGVAAHVQQHLSTHGFDERTEQLGQRVGQADQAMETHLHEKFDHQIGQLADTTGTSRGATSQPVHQTPAEGAGTGASSPDVAPGGISADVRAILRTPTNMRQAVILSEIIKRPEW